MTSSNTPPVARIEFHKVTQFGDTRVDPFHWLRTADWKSFLRDPALLEPDIRAFLEANNAHYDHFARESGIDALAQEIGSEMIARIIPNDASVPMRNGEWEYWSEYREGANYPVYLRRHCGDGRTQTVFDVQKESEGQAFFYLGALVRSPDQSMVAYATDTSGAEYFDIRFRAIETGDEYPESLTHTKGEVVWAKDGRSLYYVMSDDEHKARWVKCHVLGTDPASDVTVFEQADDRFFLSIDKSQSGEYMFIRVRGSDTSDTHVLRTDAIPGTQPQLMTPRVEGHKYSPEHRGDFFYIRTNTDGAVNFKVMRAPITNPDRANWEDVIPYNPAISISGILTLKDYCVRLESENALPRIVVSDYAGREFTLAFKDEAYALTLIGSAMFDTDEIRVAYETPAHPGQTIDVNLQTGAHTIRKERILPNGHDPAEYVVERRLIDARDGAQIPVTIIRHQSVAADGSAPVYLYGYGSYGISIDATFSSRAISIVDRGVVYAIAHIRGGGDKGQEWYYDGKMDQKQNTFNDFVDSAQGLIALGYGKAGSIVIEGRSAGGLLVGAALNQAPEGLFGGAIGAVPFVDALNTISDASLPLTPPEWTEWGNPLADPAAYERIKSYSPYDNIDPQRIYPPVLATGGLTDPRVTYWEPAKWIARLRSDAKGGPFFLKIDMDSGHLASPDRFKRAREAAGEIAFNLGALAKAGHDLTLRSSVARAIHANDGTAGNDSTNGSCAPSAL